MSSKTTYCMYEKAKTRRENLLVGRCCCCRRRYSDIIGPLIEFGCRADTPLIKSSSERLKIGFFSPQKSRNFS